MQTIILSSARKGATRSCALALIGALAACSGGGSSAPAPAGIPTTPSPVATSPGAKSASIVFKMKWPAPAASAQKRQYLPASARSVSIAVNAGVPQYLNSPASTLTIAADPGVDTFAIASYDEQNGQGNVLSRASVTQTVVAGTGNVLSATLNGVIASLTAALANPSPNAGVPATIAVNVAGLDADGNVIVGPGDYGTPIELSISYPTAKESGSAALSTASVANSTVAPTITYDGATLTSAIVTASATGIAPVTATLAPAPTFYQFGIPVSTNRPQFIAAGSDGNMWFSENPGNAIARITPAGTVMEFTVPTASSDPQQIIGASDGNLWFSEFGANKITKLTTSGAFTEYTTLFAPPPNDSPAGLVDRGDGNIWYVANGSARIGFQGITSGVAGETSVPTSSSGPYDIATAPDNNLYYTESNVDKIGRITNLFTTQTEIALTAGSIPEQIVRGPNGNVWFTENGTSKIGELSPSAFAVVAEYATLTPNAAPVDITVGQDGALWFTESGLDRIGRITTGGTVSEFKSPVTGLGLKGIAVAPDGSLWFCEPGTGLSPGRIGKLVY